MRDKLPAREGHIFSQNFRIIKHLHPFCAFVLPRTKGKWPPVFCPCSREPGCSPVSLTLRLAAPMARGWGQKGRYTAPVSPVLLPCTGKEGEKDSFSFPFPFLS